MASKERDPQQPAETDLPAEARIRDLAGIIRRFRAGDYAAAEALSGAPGACLDELCGEVRALGQELAGKRKQREERLSALAETVLLLAGLNFNVRAAVSQRHDTIDGLAAGLNMLREELETSTVSRTYLDNIFASMSDALVVAGGDGAIGSVNQATLDLLGYEEQELVGRPVADLLLPRLSDADFADVRGREMRCATKHGGEVTVSMSTSLLRGRTGRPEGLVCVLRDITERKQAEEERQRLEGELETQAELIRKMSTPIIPINDEVVVMPLVGAVDRARADQIVESLLQGIASMRPRMAILDITAVAFVDADVAATIVRAANAARLLGVRVILTGVRPEVARTLVELGFDLGAVIPCGTLKSGIALSMKRESKPRRS